MKNILLLLAVNVFLLVGCIETVDEVIEIEEEPSIETIVEIDEENFASNSSKIVRCHIDQNWSEEKIKIAIIGKWKYVIGWCGWTGLITPDFDEQSIIFREDGTAIIKTDADEETTTWEVITSNTSVGIGVEGFGGFYVCGDKITTYTSPSDGCDLTFSK